MKTVLNRTSRPIRVSLPTGGILHLGPHREGHIQDRAVEGAGIQRRLLVGDIQILDSESDAIGTGGLEAMHAESHKHHRRDAVIRGDR